MKANELRIGNWVETKYGIRKISSLDTTNCSTLIDKCKISQKHFSYNEINPIVISEEVLLKCGFELNSIPYHAIKGQVFLSLFRGVWTFEIKHLHQLQNLYFALTGIELEINL